MQTRIMLDRSAERHLPVVLLIDDDLVSREVTATVLTMAGFTVHTAVSGDAALEMLTKGVFRPGVILTDAQMPGLSGTKLIAELRSHTKARIYVISGSNAPPEVAECGGRFSAEALQCRSPAEADRRATSRMQFPRCSIRMSLLSASRFLLSYARSCPSQRCGKSTLPSSPI